MQRNVEEFGVMQIMILLTPSPTILCHCSADYPVAILCGGTTLQGPTLQRHYSAEYTLSGDTTLRIALCIQLIVRSHFSVEYPSTTLHSKLDTYPQYTVT